MVMISCQIEDNINKKLNEIMKRNNYKSKSEAIRECIDVAYNNDNIKVYLGEENRKINRISHNVFLIKKLLEQFFANNGFRENINVKDDKCLNDFFEEYSSYNNDFLG